MDTFGMFFFLDFGFLDFWSWTRPVKKRRTKNASIKVLRQANLM